MGIKKRFASEDYVNEKILENRSDWNQNDETALDYIKNRPFYEYTETILDTITVNNGDALDINISVDCGGLGTVVTVIWDGVHYEKAVGECDISSGRWGYSCDTIGNQSFLNDSNNTFEDTGEEYLIERTAGKSNTTIHCDDNSHTLSIIKQIAVEIDDKFLPNIFKGTGKESLIFNSKLNVASGDYSHAEGYNTTASGICSHAEGANTTASSQYSHAEGSVTTASGQCSHAEGSVTAASGSDSHAEGTSTTASGNGSHAEGSVTTASGQCSHAEGYKTIASSNYQHVQGKCNIEDANNIYAHIVGNGESGINRSNAHTLDWNGNAEYAGDVKANGCGGESPVSLIEVADRVKVLEAIGNVTPNAPEFNWQIAQIDKTTGALTSDEQSKMRIAVSLVKFDSPATIEFPTTDKYQYCICVYDLDGVLIEEETAFEQWQTNPTYEINRDRLVSIKVKETNYAAWTEETIAAYADAFKVTISDESVVGLINSLDSKITENTNSIESIQSILNNFDETGSVTTNVYLSYDNSFFDSLENGEISWQNGQNVSDGISIFVRSADYKLVSCNDGILIMTMPSSAKVSLYTYTYVNGTYNWEAVSDWYTGSPTFQVEKGKYYRVLFYDANGISPADCNVVLSGTLFEDAIEKVVNNHNLLDYVLTTEEQVEMNTTKNTIKSLVTPNTALVATFADLHITCSTDNEVLKNNSANIQKSFTQYNKIAEDCKIDACMWLGDYLNNSSETNKETALKSLAMLKTFAGQMDSSAPMMILKGNHDDNTMYTDYTNGWVQENYLYNVLLNVDEDRVNRHTDFIERGYGYYDIPNKKIRIFGLNTVDINQSLTNNTLDYKGQWTYGFRQEQLDFIIENLKFDESGWQVMFFGHHPIEAVGITGDGVDYDKGGAAFLSILDGFVNKTSGSYSTTTSNFESEITYDFTNNKSNTVIACIYGHTHKDVLRVYNGINHFSTKAVCGYDSSTSYSARSTYFVIDRKNKILTAVANGDGNDYTIKYGTSDDNTQPSVKPIVFRVGASVSGDDCEAYTNEYRMMATQSSGVKPYSNSEVLWGENAYPIKVPSDATKIKVICPDFIFGLIFVDYENGGYVKANDEGWQKLNNGEYSFEAGLYDYVNVNFKHSSEGIIPTDTDTSGFSIVFE